MKPTLQNVIWQSAEPWAEDPLPFRDRAEAGRSLAARLMKYANRQNVRVLALPRGCVPVAFEIAEALHAPLDVFLVRKLGVPGHEELAMGALASGGVRVLDRSVMETVGASREDIDAVTAKAQGELERQERAFRPGRPELDLHDQIVILVDDGIATGSTMRAAILALRQLRTSRIVVAVPVAPTTTVGSLAAEADEVVCLHNILRFSAVGVYYQDFSQVSDDQVKDLLLRAVAIWK